MADQHELQETQTGPEPVVGEYPPANEPLPPELAEIIKPQDTAIIVVDVMDAYFDPQAVLPKLAKAGTTQLEEASHRIRGFIDESRKYPVATTVFARMVERPESMTDNYKFKMEYKDTPPLVEVDGAGWAYHGTQPQEGDHEVVKTHYNAFSGTDLHEHLQQRGVRTLVIIGGYGSRCVAATAIVGADVYGYNVFVPKDLIANLDEPDTTSTRGGVDEIPGFLQALDTIWGYAPNSGSILRTWERPTTQD